MEEAEEAFAFEGLHESWSDKLGRGEALRFPTTAIR